MRINQEQRKIVNEINDYKKGVRYYTEEIENNPNNDFIQTEYKRRKDNLLILINQLRIKLTALIKKEN